MERGVRRPALQGQCDAASVEEGITDIGWVFSFLEPAKLPLSQASSYAPFSTNSPAVQLEVMSDLFASDDATLADRILHALAQHLRSHLDDYSRSERARAERFLHQ